MALLLNEGLDESSATGKIDLDYNRTSSRTYYMIFNTGDNEQFVIDNCGITMWSAHPNKSSLLVSSLSASPVGEINHNGTNARRWAVQVEYGTPPPLRVVGGPLQQPVRKTMVPYLKSEAAYKDFSGVPILNTAGDPFNPPLEIERMCLNLTVHRNEVAPNIQTLVGLSNKVNLATWNGFAAKTVKVLPIELPFQEYDNESGQLYYPMKYNFDIDPNNWKAKVLNQGFRELKSGKIIKIIGDDNEPVDDPVLLKTDGSKVAYPATSSTIVIREFDVFATTDFSVFNMDTLF